MMKQMLIALASILALAALPGCSPKAKVENKNAKGKESHAEHADEGQHGGALIEIGAHVAHVEFVHDNKAGSATLYFTGKDAKAALAIADAPELKLVTDSGPQVLKTEAVDAKDGKSAQYTVNSEHLKTDPIKGHISVKIDGKPYSPPIKEAHDHGEGHDHGKEEAHEEGHDHGKEEAHEEGHDHGKEHDNGKKGDHGHDH